MIAALWLQRQLSADVNLETLNAGALTALAGSRVSDAKTDKVLEQLSKIAGKFGARVDAIVEKYENPPPAKKGGGGFQKKK